MADKPKRKLRAPKTIREQATSNSAASKKPVKPKIRTKVKKVLAWPFRTLAKPFRALNKKLARFRLYRLLTRLVKFLSKILLINYLIGSWQELKLVTWPSRRESWRLTFAVLIFAIVFGALVASLDFGLNHLFKTVILGTHK